MTMKDLLIIGVPVVLLGAMVLFSRIDWLQLQIDELHRRMKEQQQEVKKLKSTIEDLELELKEERE